MVMEMSKTYQYRKVMKPLLERKRRARINKCLDDLKDLMVECLQQEGEHVTRLEKADILELTVEHMRKLKQRGGLSLNAPTSAAHVESFRSGYVHAADQISQVLLHQRHNDEVGAKILKFLSTRLLKMQPQLYHNAKSTPPTTTTFSMLPFEPTAGINRLSSVTSLTPIDVHTRRNILTTNRNICMTGKDLANSCDLLIDVTTVDNVSSDNASVISVDSSSSSDTVWRPW